MRQKQCDAARKEGGSGSDKGGSDAARGSDEAKNHFPSLPARANQEAGFAPTPRYGRGSDLEVIVEVIGSADRLPKDYSARSIRSSLII